MKRIKIPHIIIVLTFLLLPTMDIFAQCFGPADDTGTCCLIPGACGATCPPCTTIPLDGGLSALLIAGVAFGVKKVKGKINL